MLPRFPDCEQRVAEAVFPRSHADEFTEGAGKIVAVFKTGVIGDFRDAAPGFLQFAAGVIDAQVKDILER